MAGKFDSLLDEDANVAPRKRGRPKGVKNQSKSPNQFKLDQTVEQGSDDLLNGVSIQTLCAIFRLSRTTVVNRLKDCPVRNTNKVGVRKYDLATAAQYLVDPKVSLEELVGELKPEQLPERNRGVLAGKLLQFANGGLYRLDEDVFEATRETIKIHDYKLRALESIVEEAAGQNILVAYSFQFDKDQIRKRFPKAVFYDERRSTFVRDWNAGKIQMGVAHPASIGHGLNLQDGGHIQVWYGLTWSLELWDQFNRRLARPGQQNHHVFIHVIMAKGTLDEVQYDLLQTKGIEQDDITEHVRVRLAA